MVQTDNDTTFTHSYPAGPKTPLDRPAKVRPFTAMCWHFRAPHRLIPPRTPRLNDEVERSHQMDEKEFYRLRPYRTRQDLQQAFARWLWHYNHAGLHMGPDGKTPIQVLRSFPEYAHSKQLRCHPSWLCGQYCDD
jgi:transposase InsO family protein